MVIRDPLLSIYLSKATQNDKTRHNAVQGRGAWESVESGARTEVSIIYYWDEAQAELYVQSSDIDAP